MGVAEYPAAGRLAKQMVVAHNSADADVDFADVVFADAVDALRDGPAELATQTLIELTRLVRLAIHLAADACESTPEITSDCLLRFYDEWLERLVAGGGGP